MNTKLSKISFSILLAALLALVSAFLAPQTARAATCTVTSALDDGSAGTLRALLADATCETIVFAGDTTINLASQLVLSRNVTIDGGTNAVVLSGDTNGDGTGEVRVLTINAGTTVTLQNLTVTRGYSTGDGAGIYNAGTLAVTGSTFSSNSGRYGGAILNHGSLTITGSTFSGNSATYGGSIYNHSSTLQVTDSTFSGNSATYGGGIHNYAGMLNSTNNTFSGNNASYGGGIYNQGGTVTSTNSIFVKGSGPNCNGTPGGSNNLANDTSCGTAASTAILLGPLGDYGGPTLTFPLLPGSAAIDAGDSASCPATDQRGKSRVGISDIGAFESQGFTLAASGGNDQKADPGVAFASPLEVTASANASGEPVDGGLVTFTAPASGASATLASSPATISGGKASVTATANSTPGSYSMTASTAGASSVDFALENNRPTAVVVTSSADSGPGTLRQAIADIAPAGTITFASDMTIHLASKLTIDRNVTIDGGTSQVVLSGDSNNDGMGEVQVCYVPSGVTATMNHLTVANGLADRGGGIFTDGTLTVANSSFSGNSATNTSYGGGAIFNTGTLTVNYSTFSRNSGNRGGGIFAGGLLGTLTVTNSTFSDNSATFGGGIFHIYGPATVTNNTFSGNSATYGGGIYNSYGSLTATNSTFSGNSAPSGGGVYRSDGTFSSKNSIYVKGASGANCYGVTGGANNLGDDTSCTGLTYSSSIRLGTLGDYGGATQTFPLLPGSSAIDIGSATYCPVTDQRGKARVGTCDIGAFESQGFNLSRLSGNLQNAPVNSAFASPLVVGVTSPTGEPVDGGAVTFSGPASGASATFTGNPAVIANGQASVTATANGALGLYMVTASTKPLLNAAPEFTLNNTKAAASVTLTSSPNPSAYKQRVTFTATASGSSGTPSGTVTFYENAPADAQSSSIEKAGPQDLSAQAESAGGNVVALVNGVATFSTSSLSVGSHSMVAVYSGDAIYDVSTSNTVDQGVSKAPAIITQPSSQTVVEGQEASFSADAIGYPDMAVQWQESPDGKAWSDISGANAIPLTFTASFSQNGRQYRVTFSNNLGSVTSNAAILTVQQPPAVTQQPQSVTVNAGEPVTFSAAASGNPAPSVQWQQSLDQGATWTDISGATSPSYSIIASITMNGYHYHAVFTNAAGSATSDPAALTVNEVTGTASISGLVYNDVNGNGTKDRTETGLVGWNVQLFDAGGSWIADVVTDSGGSYNYTFSNLSAGVFRTRLAQPLPAGYVQTTPDPADITLAAGQQVTGVDFGAVISADLKVSMDSSASGSSITYTIIVTNDGPADAAAVSLKDTLSRYTSFVSAVSTAGTCSNKSGTVTCSLGSLASGGSATVTITVNRTSTRYAIVNTATLTSSTFDIDKADNSASVTIP